MKKAIVIIGLGEMAGVFARGFLKAGYSVYPVRRQDDIVHSAQDIEKPTLVLLAVAEKDLSSALDTIPKNWLSGLCLLQNELLPANWLDKGLQSLTVISVWFEKKSGQDFKVLVSSPVYGPHADIIVRALGNLDIPAHQLADSNELLFELVRKNLYILTTNICGLEVGGTVSQLWNDNSILMNKVFDDVMEIQQHLTAQTFNRDKQLNAVLTAFDGDPDHPCMGRTAPQRLDRALQIASEADLPVPQLKRIKLDSGTN